MKAKPKVSGYYTNNNKKKRIIKPPFKQGLYSYKNTSYNYIPKINNNNFFSYDTPNYSIINIKKDKNNIININNIYMPNEPGNSSLSFSSINLNKYKINNMPNNFDKNEIKEINDSNSIIKNTNLSMNFNLSNHSINNNNKSNPNNTMNKSIIYHDYFKDSLPYEKESRRMIIEFAKLNLNKKKDIKQIIKENNISLKILNQKYAEKDEEKDNDITNNNTNRELFGEAKKQVYLKNLDYYLSQNSTITTEVLNNKNKKFNIENNFLINNKNKKRINILNFLLTPRVLNLIEDSENKKKFIFLIALDEIFFSEGKESYLFQWKNMENNEIENQFNIKLIKNCIENKIFNNRFCLKVENQDSQQEYNYEIETPSNEICNNYVTGINYLLCK